MLRYCYSSNTLLAVLVRAGLTEHNSSIIKSASIEAESSLWFQTDKAVSTVSLLIVYIVLILPTLAFFLVAALSTPLFSYLRLNPPRPLFLLLNRYDVYCSVYFS